MHPAYLNRYWYLEPTDYCEFFKDGVTDDAIDKAIQQAKWKVETLIMRKVLAKMHFDRIKELGMIVINRDAELIWGNPDPLYYMQYHPKYTTTGIIRSGKITICNPPPTV